MHGDFTPFMSKNIQIQDHSFLLISPKYSYDLKSLDIGLMEVGAKRRLNGMNKRGKIRKNLICRGNFRHSLSKNVHI